MTIIPYTRLEGGFYANPKYLGLPDKAFRLWTLALNWSVSTGSDGVIPADVRRRNTPERALFSAFVGGRVQSLDRAIGDLVRAGRWEPREGGSWAIHDYRKSQLSKAQVEQLNEDSERDRELARERQRRRRDSTPGGNDVDNPGEQPPPEAPDPVAGEPRAGPMSRVTVTRDSHGGKEGRGEGQEEEPTALGFVVDRLAALVGGGVGEERAADFEVEELVQDPLPAPLREVLTESQAADLTKICRSQPRFRDLTPGQLERYRLERGEAFLTEVIRVLYSSVPDEVIAPGGYVDRIATRVAVDFDAHVARKASRSGPDAVENGAESARETTFDDAAEAAEGGA